MQVSKIKNVKTRPAGKFSVNLSCAGCIREMVTKYVTSDTEIGSAKFAKNGWQNNFINLFSKIVYFRNQYNFNLVEISSTLKKIFWDCISIRDVPKLGEQSVYIQYYQRFLSKPAPTILKPVQLFSPRQFYIVKF